jgi:hypothetical protein
VAKGGAKRYGVGAIVGAAVGCKAKLGAFWYAQGSSEVEMRGKWNVV